MADTTDEFTDEELEETLSAELEDPAELEDAPEEEPSKEDASEDEDPTPEPSQPASVETANAAIDAAAAPSTETEDATFRSDETPYPSVLISIPHPDSPGENYGAARFRRDFYPDFDENGQPHRQARQYHGPGYFWTDDPYIASHLRAIIERAGDDSYLHEVFGEEATHGRKVWEKVERLYREV